MKSHRGTYLLDVLSVARVAGYGREVGDVEIYGGAGLLVDEKVDSV